MGGTGKVEYSSLKEERAAEIGSEMIGDDGGVRYCCRGHCSTSSGIAESRQSVMTVTGGLDTLNEQCSD